ncbi:EF hand domain containing protein [Acanthamoeba castellanii str. Neff]|uniref:EF hand domain containing protein n=1 Tax=Acanthamoeba castellanii (strain ATCC 30010 / Neff) TaxID=1257118 RepID=L8GLM8_ACACF|nr:EF hand domain containing protein [Acanthamoeba castellanii str. Neff]ELR13985.1 EF hand domain containing protein [Acanthamoeba castellanii str. Neff]
MATSEEEIKEAFNCFDTDHTGLIAADDIGTVIRALGKAPLERELDQIIAEAGEGPVDFNKFKGLYRKKLRRPQELEKDMRQAFRLLDNTGTASSPRPTCALGEPLSSEEVHTLFFFDVMVVKVLTWWLGCVVQIDSLLKACEVDAEGNLKYDEFVDLLIQ